MSKWIYENWKRQPDIESNNKKFLEDTLWNSWGKN